MPYIKYFRSILVTGYFKERTLTDSPYLPSCINFLQSRRGKVPLFVQKQNLIKIACLSATHTFLKNDYVGCKKYVYIEYETPSQLVLCEIVEGS